MYTEDGTPVDHGDVGMTSKQTGHFDVGWTLHHCDN